MEERQERIKTKGIRKNTGSPRNDQILGEGGKKSSSVP